MKLKGGAGVGWVRGVLQPGLPSTHSPSAPERPGLLPSAQDASGVGGGWGAGMP